MAISIQHETEISYSHLLVADEAGADEAEVPGHRRLCPFVRLWLSSEGAKSAPGG